MTERRFERRAEANFDAGEAVLVVDDSATYRELVADLLRQAGYEALGAKDGRDALELARARSFGLVIADLQLPGMDGISLVARLRRLPGYRSVPICIMSSESSRARIQEGREAGVAGWMVKPVTSDALVTTVRRLLKRSAPRKAVKRDPSRGS